MSTPMPGDERVLGKRVMVTLLVTWAVAILVTIAGLFAGIQIRFGMLDLALPAIILGVVTSLVWWNRARIVSRRIVAQLFEGAPPPPEASELMEELREIRSLVDEPRFWGPSLRFARRGVGARCRELADDARQFGLDEIADRLLLLGAVLDRVRVEPASAGLRGES